MASLSLSLTESQTTPASPASLRDKPAGTAVAQDHPEWLRTRRQIRRAAARLIGERGVLRATPRAILRAAGLPGIALSQCYPTREVLLADIMSHHLDGLTCWVIAARDAAIQEGSAAQMEAMIGAFLASALAERNEHRLLLHVWTDDASRKSAISLVETVVDVALGAALDGGLRVTLRRQDRTDTAIDAVTGRARAAVSMTFYTEPDA